MDSARIGKIMKAKQYAQEPERIQIHDLSLTFQGTHSTHKITFHDGQWQCDCDFFLRRGFCSHTMAIERVFDGMLVEPEEELEEVHSDVMAKVPA